MTATNQTTVSDARKGELQAKGYWIEDMGAVWGADFKGRYRWMLSTIPVACSERGELLDWGEEAYSVEEAWSLADEAAQEACE
ncbi:hypothetical protein [Achromobacter sp. AGC39]